MVSGGIVMLLTPVQDSVLSKEPHRFHVLQWARRDARRRAQSVIGKALDVPRLK